MSEQFNLPLVAPPLEWTHLHVHMMTRRVRYPKQLLSEDVSGWLLDIFCISSPKQHSKQFRRLALPESNSWAVALLFGRARTCTCPEPNPWTVLEHCSLQHSTRNGNWAQQLSNFLKRADRKGRGTFGANATPQANFWPTSTFLRVCTLGQRQQGWKAAGRTCSPFWKRTFFLVCNICSN